MSVFSNKGAIETVNYKVDFWAPAGISRKGSLVQRKVLIARGLSLFPSSTSCGYSTCYLFLP